MGRPRNPITQKLVDQGLLKCNVCNEIKPLDDFGNRSDMWHGKMGRCKPCNLIQHRQRVDRRRADLNILKEAQGCMICGYNEDGGKLHHHHRDKSTKLFNIGDRVVYSPQRVQEEIDKCDLLCDSCHATHHHLHG